MDYFTDVLDAPSRSRGSNRATPHLTCFTRQMAGPRLGDADTARTPTNSISPRPHVPFAQRSTCLMDSQIVSRQCPAPLAQLNLSLLIVLHYFDSGRRERDSLAYTTYTNNTEGVTDPALFLDSHYDAEMQRPANANVSNRSKQSALPDSRRLSLSPFGTRSSNAGQSIIISRDLVIERTLAYGL